MKFIIQIFIAITILAAISAAMGCSKEEIDSGDAVERDVVLSLCAKRDVSLLSETRAAVDGNAFPAGSYRFGTWICYHDSLPKYIPSKNGYANLLTDMISKEIADNSFSQEWTYSFENRPATSLNVSRRIPIDIYMFYPREASDTKNTSPDRVHFTSGATDWMWAQTSLSSEQLTGDHTEVALKFSHAMTCIRVAIKSEYPGSSISSITIKDAKSRLYSEGYMDIPHKTLILEGNGNPELKVNLSGNISNTQETVFDIFLPPVNDYNDREISLAFCFNGNDAKTEFPLPAVIRDANSEANITMTAFEVGKRYTYHLTLDNHIIFTPIGIDDTWKDETRKLKL